MKTRRIVSSLALAGAITLGATGCSLFASQATLEKYSPSDGVDVTVEGVEVRNILLITDQEGDAVNVVFTAVNTTGSNQLLRITLADAAGGEVVVDYDVQPGTSQFGNPEGDHAPVVVQVAGAVPGATVEALFSTAAGETSKQIPVLDGTLPEYRDYVLSPAAVATDDEKVADSHDEHDSEDHDDSDHSH